MFQVSGKIAVAEVEGHWSGSRKRPRRDPFHAARHGRGRLHLAARLSARETANALVDAALAQGGRDNITVIVVDVNINAAAQEVVADPDIAPVIASESTMSIKKRILALVVVIVLCSGGFIALRHQRSGYFVAFTNSSSSATIAIYKGQPGGLLWIKPTVVEVSTTKRYSMQSEFQREIDRVQQFDSVDKARSYLKMIDVVLKANG